MAIRRRGSAANLTRRCGRLGGPGRDDEPQQADRDEHQQRHDDRGKACLVAGGVHATIVKRETTARNSARGGGFLPRRGQRALNFRTKVPAFPFLRAYLFFWMLVNAGPYSR